MNALTGYGAATYGAATYGGVTVTPEPTWVVVVPAPDGTWRDLTCDVRSIDVDRGRSSWVEAFKAGTATIVLYNPAGIYSTFDPASVWLQTNGFATDVPIRAGSVVAGDIDWRFTGTTDAVFDSWPGTVDAVATVTATDGFKRLARHNGGPRAAVGAGELSGARIGRLADDAAWPGVRRIDPGVVALQATTLDGVTIDLMRQVGEAEWGWLYVAGDGALVFRGRTAQDTDPRMTGVQFTFTDTDELGVAACYGEAVIGADSDRIVNVANVTPPGLALSTFTDAVSVGWFGPRTWTRTDLPIGANVDAAGLAQLVVESQARDERRIDAVAIDVPGRAGNVAAAHACRLLDRIRFVRTYPGGHQVDAELIVQGRRDHVVPAGDGVTLREWHVEFATASALVIVGLGLWDEATWDDGLWGA